MSRSVADFNTHGYRILSCLTGTTAESVAAAFKYRGHSVSLSTYYRWGEKVLVTDLATKEDTVFETVEDAITAIDKRLMGAR